MRDDPTRIRVLVRLALTLAMALAPVCATAQEQGAHLFLQALVAPFDTLRPGSIQTLPFRIENRGNDTVSVTDRLDAPRGWTVVTSTAGLTLKPGESVTRLVSVSLSVSAEEGIHEIRYSVIPTGLEGGVTLPLPIRVAGRKQFSVQFLDGPTAMLAGEPSMARFILQNGGNIPISLYLNASMTADGQAVPDSTIMYVRPGEARDVAVRIQLMDHTRSRQQFVVSLSATVVNDSAFTRQASTVIELIPRTSAEGPDPYVRFPMRATLRYGGEEGQTGFQGELAGMGYLGAGQQDRFDLFIRTPNLQEISILGRLDEYRAALQGRSYELVVGDAAYALTPLTEYSRYAFGGGGKVALGDVELGGFYNRNRLAAFKQQEIAGFAALSVTPQAKMSLQYLGKSEDFESSIASFRTLIEPSDNSQIDGEFARSFTGGDYDDAYSLRLSGRTQVVLYDLRYILAGPNYTGYYRDTDHKTATIAVYPWKLLRLEAYYRDEDRNLDRNPALYAAPRQKYLQAGAGYGNYLTVLYKTSSTIDQLDPKKFDRSDNTVLLRSGYSARDLTLLAEAELGHIAERVFDTSGPYRRIMLFTGLYPWNGHQYGVNLEYFRDLQLQTGAPIDRVAATLSGRVAIGGHTWIDGNIHLSRTVSEPRQTYSIIEGGVLHELPFGHSVGVRGRYAEYSPSLSGSETAFLLEYSVPFGVPVSRKTTVGSLMGRIINDESGLGVDGALVSVGGQVVATDESGQFEFPGLPPGPHQLTVDMSSLPKGTMLAGSGANQVVVTGGEDREIELRTMRSVSFGGTVMLAPSDSAGAADSAQQGPSDSGVQAGVVVEAINGDLLVRRLSDQWGRYEFRDMRPGMWVLRVAGGEIPEGRRAEKDAYHLSLGAGEHQTIDIRLIQKKKAIQILDGGVLK
jgi:hypothetical protein